MADQFVEAALLAESLLQSTVQYRRLVFQGDMCKVHVGKQPSTWRLPLPLTIFSVQSEPRGVQRGKVAIFCASVLLDTWILVNVFCFGFLRPLHIYLHSHGSGFSRASQEEFSG
jgi:hypothetical protein